jgi:hypothetical protein
MAGEAESIRQAESGAQVLMFISLDARRRAVQNRLIIERRRIAGAILGRHAAWSGPT